ncbi:MAG: VWA domain-containing protein [Bacteroidaceae bacterium]|nr:VWA domain-containing protein [Bacteroidaceae bacterium]
MQLSQPYFLLLTLLLIPYIVWYIMRNHDSSPSLRVSTTEMVRLAPGGIRQYLVHIPFLLRMFAFLMIIIVLCRPQTSNSWSDKHIEGIDIMLCMDISTSMLAEDLRPNRLEAAKKVASEFISGRPNDNIGLTIFAGESFTQCPMTTDHAVLLNLFQALRCDMAQQGLIEDGTAIGMGLANAITRLKDSKAKSKVIILLTDGSNNAGDISPQTAAQIAKSFGIRIYTIGVGTTGTARYPVVVGGHTEYLNIPVEIDTKTLASIASTTDGEFYRATNNSKLRDVYQEIDKLEKTKMNVRKYSKRYEAYGIFALFACLALLLELLLRETLLRRIP